MQRLGRLLAREHEVTVVHTYESAEPIHRPDDPAGLRHVVVDPSRLPPIAFSCDDHARSAATMLAIEEAYGDEAPDYLEAPDYRGHGLIPLQARDGGHPSLRGCAIAVRLRSMAELICMRDGTWPPPRHRIVFDCEREALRLADHVVWPGGDVLDLYRRYLGSDSLPDAERIRLPVEHPGESPHPEPRSPLGPLRILYAGRLQRVKGVLSLVEACLELESEDWRLTMVGADTDTAPLAQSMRDTIETMCAGDERVELLDEVSREELGEIFPRHDLVAVPSEFEVWSNVALEAMRAGSPILATPVGGLTEIVEDGVTGWLTRDAERAAIRASLERLLANRDELERVRGSGDVFRRFELLSAEEDVLAGYRALLQKLRRPVVVRVGKPDPLVTAVVPYCGEHELVGEAVASLLDQTHRNLEVTIVNDGSFEPEDRVLAELAENERVRVLSKVNGGEQSARHLGAIDADGKYLAMLDADNALEPTFVERAVAMLEADPDLAYVTCWLSFVGDEATLAAIGAHGYPPLGNGVRSDEAVNSDGDALAVVPRRVFTELGYRYDEMAVQASDWAFYRTLKDDARFGAVIPELLARYRVRAASLSRSFADSANGISWDESLSRRRARRLRWARTG